MRLRCIADPRAVEQRFLRVALLRLATERGVVLDENAFCVLLTQCGQQNQIAIGKQVHAFACERRVAQGQYYCNSLLDMYARCGEFQLARALFEDMKSRGWAGVAHNTMIARLSDAGQITEAIALLRACCLKS